MILNPRHIPVCVTSLERIRLDQAWLTGYCEYDLPIDELVKGTRYERYMIISDDAIVSQAAVDAVLKAHTEGAQVATGYSRLDHAHPQVNLTKSPLGFPLSKEAYDLMTYEEVQAGPDLFRSWFAGWALTVMSRELWLRYPWDAGMFPGNATDYRCCIRMQRDDVRITAVKAGEVGHVKEEWMVGDRDPVKRSLVGLVDQEVRMKATQ